MKGPTQHLSFKTKCPLVACQLRTQKTALNETVVDRVNALHEVVVEIKEARSNAGSRERRRRDAKEHLSGFGYGLLIPRVREKRVQRVNERTGLVCALGGVRNVLDDLVGDDGKQMQERRVDQSLAGSKVPVDNARAEVRLLTDVEDS